ncbi:MAG: prepilin-type N-terminal cleavage/methylation domain-containing protein [Polaromonas sp.]
MSVAGIDIAPTLVCGIPFVLSLSKDAPEGAGLAWGGQALRPVAPTLAASRAAPFKRIRNAGFTLIELLFVVAIMAIATAGVGLALRDTSGTALEREAQRLSVLLESARAQSRMTASPVRWRPTATGFSFDGLTSESAFPSSWLGQDVRVAGVNSVTLGPEPVIGPQQIRLVSISEPSRSLTLATDGVRPFSVVTDSAATPGTP